MQMSRAEEYAYPQDYPIWVTLGNAFTKQYYRYLHICPKKIHKFYMESSVLRRPEANGVMSSVTTRKAIRDKILSMDYTGYKAEIETFEGFYCNNSNRCNIIITGWLNGKDNFRRKFTQSVYLTYVRCRGENYYFVLNDVLRYLDINNEELPTTTTTTDPHPAGISHAFVKRYYHVLHHSPEKLYKYYSDPMSLLRWPQPNGEMSSVESIQDIKDKILSLEYIGYKAEIETTDAYLTQEGNNEVVLLITGWLNGKNDFRKKFVRSVLLALNDLCVGGRSFYIAEDVIIYIDETELLEKIINSLVPVVMGSSSTDDSDALMTTPLTTYPADSNQVQCPTIPDCTAAAAAAAASSNQVLAPPSMQDCKAAAAAAAASSGDDERVAKLFDRFRVVVVES